MEQISQLDICYDRWYIRESLGVETAKVQDQEFLSFASCTLAGSLSCLSDLLRIRDDSTVPLLLLVLFDLDRESMVTQNPIVVVTRKVRDRMVA